MFQPLRTEIQERFETAEAHFAATRPFKGKVGSTAKGMMFVEVYAIYEFTVKTAVRTAIDSLNTRQHRLSDLTPTLLALYLDPELRSIRDTGNKSVWGARQALFVKAFSKQRLMLPWIPSRPMMEIILGTLTCRPS